MKKTVSMMTPEEKQKAIEVIGTTVLMLEEGYGAWQIAAKLKLHPWQVTSNIDEILCIIRKSIGKKRFIKSIFIK